MVVDTGVSGGWFVVVVFWGGGGGGGFIRWNTVNMYTCHLSPLIVTGHVSSNRSGWGGVAPTSAPPLCECFLTLAPVLHPQAQKNIPREARQSIPYGEQWIQRDQHTCKLHLPCKCTSPTGIVGGVVNLCKMELPLVQQLMREGNSHIKKSVTQIS